MNAAIYGLIKNLTLLALLILTVVNFLFDRIENKALLYMQLGLGALYLLTYIAETRKITSTVDSKERRFSYLTNGTIAIKAIKILALLMGGIILYISETRLKTFSIVVFIMVIVEFLLFIMKVITKAYFISFKENYILLSVDKNVKVFAKQIKSIEFRHKIFHLTKSDNKVQKIELEKLNPAEETDFTKQFVDWSLQHKLEFTTEAKEKLSL